MQDIQNNEIDLKAQQELLAAKKKEVGVINVRYNEDKRRYIELIERYTGPSPDKDLWDYSVKEHGAKVYQLHNPGARCERSSGAIRANLFPPTKPN